MKTWKTLLLAALVAAIVIVIAVVALIERGFRATTEPSTVELLLARTIRNLAIPRRVRIEKNPTEPSQENLQEAREHFVARCALRHGDDGAGKTPTGRSLYPRAPDLRSTQTQNLTDGELHYIIENGVQLTGMPAWGSDHPVADNDSWKLALFIRSLRPLTTKEQANRCFGALHRLSGM